MLPRIDRSSGMVDNIRPTQPIKVSIDIAPALNAINSIATVVEADDSPGISSWSVETRGKLSAEQYEKHKIIAHWIGLDTFSNIVDDVAQLDTFEDYLDILNTFDAVELRDKFLYWITACPGCELKYKPRPQIDDPQSLLTSWDAFWSFFAHDETDESHINIGKKVFDLYTSPKDLKSLVLDYARFFWDNYLKDEWQRNFRRLEEAQQYYRRLDFSGLSHFEIIEKITGRNMRGAFRAEGVQQYSSMRFIPSPHSGPYILMSSNFDELRIAFGAYRNSSTNRRQVSVDSQQIVEKMKALADETRFEIVELLKAEKELGTAEIIDRLNLSKSAASRHLRQLFATGIIEVRVDEDGLSKYYSVNPDTVLLLQSELGSLLG
jgi:DNA-binding transcriptional ArsR family regulator